MLVGLSPLGRLAHWRQADRRSRVYALYRCLTFKPFTNTDYTSRTKVSRFKLDNNFQQWMSRLAHRWRTLRTAIRNANCRIQWVIEILNAYCTFGLCLEVCLYQCPYNKIAFLFLCIQEGSEAEFEVSWLFLKRPSPFKCTDVFFSCSLKSELSNVVISDRFALVSGFRRGQWRLPQLTVC